MSSKNTLLNITKRSTYRTDNTGRPRLSSTRMMMMMVMMIFIDASPLQTKWYNHQCRAVLPLVPSSCDGVEEAPTSGELLDSTTGSQPEAVTTPLVEGRTRNAESDECDAEVNAEPVA